MRNLATAKKWSVLLIVAAAACSGPAANEADADNAAANSLAALEESHDAADNAVAEGNAAAPPADGNTTAAAYRASGTEPFWSLTVTDAQMVYDSADGPDVTVATPPQQPTRAGYRYVTPEMTVVVNTFQRCDAASGQEYHDTVRVTIGADTVTGCGGEVTAAAE